jgi:hypothetical protein
VHFAVADYPAYQHLIKTKAPLVINSIPEEQQMGNMADIVPRGVTSMLIAPLLIENKVAGSIEKAVENRGLQSIWTRPQRKI